MLSLSNSLVLDCSGAVSENWATASDMQTGIPVHIARTAVSPSHALCVRAPCVDGGWGDMCIRRSQFKNELASEKLRLDYNLSNPDVIYPVSSFAAPSMSLWSCHALSCLGGVPRASSLLLLSSLLLSSLLL
jgi:hypothetical protein